MVERSCVLRLGWHAHDNNTTTIRLARKGFPHSCQCLEYPVFLRGCDGPRYKEAKRVPGFWKQSCFQALLPEAACQALIMSPFRAPLMIGVRGLLSMRPWGISDLLAVGLLRAVFAIEAAADWQFESHKQSEASGLLKREGLEHF